MTRPCCKRSRCGTTFRCINGGNGERLLLAACVGLSFPDICGQRTMTNKGAKRNVPHLLQAQPAPVCLWSISETLKCQKIHGNFTKSTVSRRVCWSLTVLWSSVSADFRQFQVGGEEKKEERHGIDKKSESNNHTPHLQAQLAFAWHNRLVLDRRLSAVSWYSRCSQPTLQRRNEGVQRSIANTH